MAERDNPVMVLGGGPDRIDQGIELGHCRVHPAFALRDLGHETVLVSRNPATVSTDYDTSEKQYLEPLTVEDVVSIHEQRAADRHGRAARRAERESGLSRATTRR